MKKNKLAVLTSCLVLSGTFCTAGTKQNTTGNPDTGYLQINEQVYLPEWLDRFQQEWEKGCI